MEILYRIKRNHDSLQLSAESTPLAVIGELNVDLILTGLNAFPQLGREVLAQNFEMVLGSASAIFASGLVRLGHPIKFHSRVGDDDFGHFCRGARETMGMPYQMNGCEVSKSSRTGVTVALSTTFDRALATFLGAIAELGYEDLPAKRVGRRFLPSASGFLHISCNID